ncbi:hypothetical protein AGMMS49990_09020 [Endomicrobiia bacterium]|nr:hypothetical protein AGMMS49990_09020 [Endomicrobiia bacterium]
MPENKYAKYNLEVALLKLNEKIAVKTIKDNKKMCGPLCF